MKTPFIMRLFVAGVLMYLALTAWLELLMDTQTKEV